MPTVEEVVARANSHGVGDEFAAILHASESSGLYLRPWTKSVMITPPQRRDRTLFTVWSDPSSDGRLQIWFGAGPIAEFYPVSEQQVEHEVRETGWAYLSKNEALDFAEKLSTFFARLSDAT